MILYGNKLVSLIAKVLANKQKRSGSVNVLMSSLKYSITFNGYHANFHGCLLAKELFGLLSFSRALCEIVCTNVMTSLREFESC